MAPCRCWSRCPRPGVASATTRAARARTSGERPRHSSELLVMTWDERPANKGTSSFILWHFWRARKWATNIIHLKLTTEEQKIWVIPSAVTTPFQSSLLHVGSWLWKVHEYKIIKCLRSLIFCSSVLRNTGKGYWNFYLNNMNRGVQHTCICS